MSRLAIFILNVSLILTAVALGIKTFFDRGLMEALFSRGGYYLILFLFLLWIISIFACIFYYRFNPRSFVKRYGLGLMISLLLSVIVFVSVKPYFRVLSDETNLLADSKSMVYEKRIDNVTMGMWYYDNFYPLHRETPKRPLLFPFFIYILHTILGYRPENAFNVNFLVLFSLLSLIYIMVKNRLNDLWAISALVLVVAQPVVSQTATSGCFDFLSALFMVVCFMCLRWFLEEPSAIRFQLLWVSLLMSANIRHEGIVFFIITLGALALFKYIKIGFFKTNLSFVYFGTPLILLLTFWQRLLVKDPFEVRGAAFTIKNFIGNNVIAFKTLFDYNFLLPYATIINFIGFLSLIYFVYLFFSSRLYRERRQRHLALISCACLSALWVVYLFYHNGEMNHPSNSRYFVIFCVLLSLLALTAASRFRFFRDNTVYFLMVSLLMFMLYHPLSVEDRFSRMQTLPRQYKYVMNFLTHESKKNKNFLVIADRPGQYTVHNYGAVNFNYANTEDSVSRKYKQHLFENIFVIQDIEYRTQEPSQNMRLDERYKLEVLSELQNKAGIFTRISKVSGIGDK